MAQQNRIGKTATKITKIESLTGKYVAVKYHDTNVVEFDDTTIRLNTGGWFTNTTKTRMNQTSNEFGLGYSVKQVKGSWICTYKGNEYEFNGSTLTLNVN